jgi:hypothetical protein
VFLFISYSFSDVTDDAVDESRESDSDEEPDPEPVQQRGPAYDYAPYDNWLMAFNGTAVGPKHIPEEADEISIMQLFLTDEILNKLVIETNRYAKQYLDSHPNLPTFSRFLKWYDTTLPEMRAFIAILLLTGISKRSSYDLYWSSDPLIDMKGFRDIMSRDRFMNIMSFFHVVNNDDALPRDHPNHDKAFKIRPMIDAFVPLWQRYYNLDREIAID